MALHALLPILAIALASAANAYTPPRTADGKPDMQGVWANNTATPLERPAMLQGRAFLTEQEVAALQQRYAQIFAGDGDAAFGDAIFEAVLLDVQKYQPTTFDVPTGNYNAFWLVERDFDNRTSLITDPPDGRMPAVVPEAAGRTMVAYPTQSAEGPEARGLSERCITFGVPDVLAGYNSYFQIVQSPGAVVLHWRRFTTRASCSSTAGRTAGSDPSVGRRLARTLGRRHARRRDDQLCAKLPDRLGSAAPDRALHARRPDTLQYEITVDDPTTWTRPWTLMIPLKRSEQHIYEYACHEGNFGLSGILSGARAEEAK